jgi:glycosyltransferase involved in cell wall biosynthesis
VYYDLQENYWRNIMYTKTFPGILRPLLAGYVRMKERLLHGFIRNYLVAEKGYLKEMPFIRRKSVVLENRYKELEISETPRVRRKDVKTIIFSGTLSRSTGVFEAVNLARKLFAMDPSIRLTIVGYCPRPDEYRDLLAAVQDCSFISLHGGDGLVAHPEIIRHIRESDFGLIAYDITPATENRVPTKLFEYLANDLAVISKDHPLWLDFIREYREPVIFDPTWPDVRPVLEKMYAAQCAQVTPRPGLLWSDVEPRLLALFAADGQIY